MVGRVEMSDGPMADRALMSLGQSPHDVVHAASGAVILAAAGLGLAAIGLSWLGLLDAALPRGCPGDGPACRGDQCPLQLIAWAGHDLRAQAGLAVLAVLGRRWRAAAAILGTGTDPPRGFSSRDHRPVPAACGSGGGKDPTVVPGSPCHQRRLKAVLRTWSARGPVTCRMRHLGPGWWTPLSIRGHSLTVMTLQRRRIFLAPAGRVNQARTEAYGPPASGRVRDSRSVFPTLFPFLRRVTICPSRQSSKTGDDQAAPQATLGRDHVQFSSCRPRRAGGAGAFHRAA